MLNLQKLCESAYAIGKQIDISGCHYGLHKRSGLFLKETYYYRVLAGFVSLLKLRRILEIGTHFGGSIMAMSRGIPPCEPSTLVTVDKTYENEEGFAAFPQIIRIRGDSAKEETVQQVKTHFARDIDLLYIDSVHKYDHTKKNIDLYAGIHSPKYLILDDVHLNPDMERLWNEIAAQHGERCWDAGPLVKRPTGFGVVQWR